MNTEGLLVDILDIQSEYDNIYEYIDVTENGYYTFGDFVESIKDIYRLNPNLGEFYIDNSERNRKNKSFGDEEYILSVYDENENEVIRIYFVLVYKPMPYELEDTIKEMFNN